MRIEADAVIDEHLHAGERVALRVQSLRLDEGPPLAIERTTLPGGPPRGRVILVHGFAQNRLTWRVTQRSMSGWLAARGYDVWNLELRGHGNSRAYGSGNARSFSDYVDDLVRTVAAGDDRPFVIGHSLGGGVGIAASTVVPLAGVVHLAGVYVFATDNPFLKAVGSLSHSLSPLLLAPQIRVSTGWAGRLISKMYGFTDATGYAFPISGWAPGSVERELLDERLSGGFDWTSAEVWLEMARWAHGEEFPYAPAFRTTDVPLLVLAGDQDTLLTPKDARRCYVESGSTDKSFVVFEPFEHEVHWGHLDLVLGTHAPKHVWSAIGAWLDAR